MPPETISKYGSRGLTPEQTANEATAQAIRFGTATPTPTPETKPYSTSPELTAMSIANSPTTTPKRTIKEPTAPTMPTYQDAYNSEYKNAQNEINSLNKYANEQLQALQPRQDERLRETSSVNTLTGLAGSTEANRTTEKTTAVNQKENDLVRAEAAMKAQQILGNVSSKAVATAKAQREAFTAEYEMDQATKLAKQTEDFNEAITLAQSGIDLNAYKTQDPEAYAYLAESLGGEEMLKATFTLNRPQETVLDKRIENGKYVIAYQNPIDGKVRIETVDLGIPVGYTKTIDAGNRILAIPDDWDGDPSKLVTINKGLTPGQAVSGGGSGGGASEQLYSGLSSGTATAVRSKVGKFSSEPIVQNFATIQEGYNFAQSIDTKTTNPADDQALIYSLAKALDPGSVVREGEYATAQKYAQSWVAAFGKGVEQALLGNGFLSETARNNIKTTIGQKYKSSQVSYDNVFTQYEKNINSLTGRNDGKAFLVDYQTPTQSSSQGGNNPAQALAEQFDYDYEAMVASGMSDDEIISAIQNQ